MHAVDDDERAGVHRICEEDGQHVEQSLKGDSGGERHGKLGVGHY